MIFGDSRANRAPKPFRTKRRELLDQPARFTGWSTRGLAPLYVAAAARIRRVSLKRAAAADSYRFSPFIPLKLQMESSFLGTFIVSFCGHSAVSFCKDIPRRYGGTLISFRRNATLFSLLQLRTRAQNSPLLPIKPSRGRKHGLKLSCDLRTQFTSETCVASVCLCVKPGR